MLTHEQFQARINALLAEQPGADFTPLLNTVCKENPDTAVIVYGRPGVAMIGDTGDLLECADRLEHFQHCPNCSRHLRNARICWVMLFQDGTLHGFMQVRGGPCKPNTVPAHLAEQIKHLTTFSAFLQELFDNATYN